ncbi:MAG: sulfite exporter TauE/SafE family protein [Luteolibacter sp.]
MNALALLGAVGIGLVLGLTGSGGSILTLPVLVYLAGVSPHEAVGLSLLIVGAAAMAGVWQRARVGEVYFKAVMMFSVAGMPGALLGSKLTHWVSPSVLMLTFAGLMIALGVRMMRMRQSSIQPEAECRPLRCLMAGGSVGILTGFLGVGGGFLLVPALVKFARLPVRVAGGTSLAIIAANSAAGFFSHIGETSTPWPVAAVFISIAIAGVLIGGKIAGRLSENMLQKGFAVLVFLTAAFVIWSTLGRDGL